MEQVQKFMQDVLAKMAPVSKLERLAQVEKQVLAFETMLTLTGGFVRAITPTLTLDTYAIRASYDKMVEKTAEVLDTELASALQDRFLRKHPSVTGFIISEPELSALPLPDAGGFIGVYAHCLIQVTLESPYNTKFTYGTAKGYAGFKPVHVEGLHVEENVWV